MRARMIGLLFVSCLLASCLSGCSSDSDALRVVFWRYGSEKQTEDHMNKMKVLFERTHPGVPVKLIPVTASEGDYPTKVQLMQRAAATAPDVIYEDSFFINSDVDAGYLLPLDNYVRKWPDWKQFSPSLVAGATALDGKVYGVPTATDTRALWFNKQILAKAGLPVNWQPKNWQDVLSAARTIKAKVPGVIPLSLEAGQGAGEAGTMQTMLMLVGGTATGDIFNRKTNKWIAPNKGMADAFNFVHTAFSEGLAPTPQQIADPQWSQSGLQVKVRQSKVGIFLDGSWWPKNWQSDGPTPWPGWQKVLGMTPMPTQYGQAPGKISYAGAWTLGIGAKSRHHDLAFDFISTALNKENSLSWNVAASGVPVRRDVGADPRATAGNEQLKFWISLIDSSKIRPTMTEYPKISKDIQLQLEAVVDGKDPNAAARDWAADVPKDTAGLHGSERG